MDTQRDMLTTLHGTIIDGKGGKSVSGRDAARLTDNIDVKQLLRVCKDLLKASRATGYKQRFPWADQVEPITSETEIAKLDTDALTLLLEGKLDTFDLYPPEMVDEAAVDYGTDAGAKTTVMEPTRTLLKHKIERSGASNPEQLRKILDKQQITARNDEGVTVGRWSWWECLFHESHGRATTDVLDRGVWLRVRKDYADAINNFAAALEPSDLNLPDASRNDLEDAYNKRVARGRADIRLLDKKLIAPIPGESRIEICDLFCERGHLVHVKRRTGSSGLSHLFGQALVSSQLLAEEPAFAAGMRTALGNWSRLVKDPPVRGEHRVVLAVILAGESSGRGAKALPFFSKIFLRQTVQGITRMGYTVHYDEIPAPLTVATGQRSGGPKPASRRRRKS